MTPDPIESPLATRARANEAAGPASGASAERVLLAALARPPLQREWLTLEAWFQALDAVDQAAIATALARKVQPEFVPIIRANAGLDPSHDQTLGSTSSPLTSPAAGPEGDAAGAPNAPTGAPGAAPGIISGPQSAGVPVGSGTRAERFDNFADLARPARHATAPPDGPAGSSAAQASDAAAAGSSQNRFRSFRSLGASQTPSAGASPFVNSFISPVPKSGLYSQAFAPLGQRQQPFTPWSLSQEINRPKSATELNPSSSPTYSPYQSHPWGQPGPQSGFSSTGGLDLMRGGQAGGESKLQPVSKRWTASPIRPKTGPSGASSASAGPHGSSAPSGAPGSPAMGSATDMSPAAGPIGPLNPAPGSGPDTPTSRREDKVWNGKPFQPSYATAVASPSVTQAPVSASSSAISEPSGNDSAPGSPRAGSQPPYTKRSVNYMDIELLADMGAWLRSLRLHKYTENLSDIPWQQVVLLSDEDLEARGVNALGARRKMLKMFEEIRAAQDTGKLPK